LLHVLGEVELQSDDLRDGLFQSVDGFIVDAGDGGILFVALDLSEDFALIFLEAGSGFVIEGDESAEAPVSPEVSSHLSELGADVDDSLLESVQLFREMQFECLILLVDGCLELLF